jgi:hypothetical protein
VRDGEYARDAPGEVEGERCDVLVWGLTLADGDAFGGQDAWGQGASDILLATGDLEADGRAEVVFDLAGDFLGEGDGEGDVAGDELDRPFPSTIPFGLLVSDVDGDDGRYLVRARVGGDGEGEGDSG